MKASCWKLPLLLITSVVFVGFASGVLADAEMERQNVISACTGCHCLDYYITPRSRKAWELTVANMRDYAQYGTSTFSAEQGDRVVAYLATYFHEDSALDSVTHFEQASASEPPPVSTMPPPAEKPVVAAVPPPAKPLPPALQARLDHPKWKPSHAVKRVAEAGGYLAVACAVLMFLTGHNRRRLARRFRPLHIFAALGLFLGLATHAIIYLAQYGNPPVLWYWFGIGSFLVLVLAQLQGLIRKQFGPLFLRLHVTAGYFGLALAVLHWIWAWL